MTVDCPKSIAILSFKPSSYFDSFITIAFSSSTAADTVAGGCSVVDGCSDTMLSGSVLNASLFASSDSLVSDATTLSFVSSAVEVAY